MQNPRPPHPTVSAALDELRQSATPPLTNLEAPVQLGDLPSGWRGHLLDHPYLYGSIVPPGCVEVDRLDWARLLTLLSCQLDWSLQLRHVLRSADAGPQPDDLDRAPLLTSWSPATAWHRGLVLSGQMTSRVDPGGRWTVTSLLVGLDPDSSWARAWTGWYRLGEAMTAAHLLSFCLSRLPVDLIQTDDVQLARHFATLRQRTNRMLEPLTLSSRDSREGTGSKHTDGSSL